MKKVTLWRRLAAVTVIVLQVFLSLPCNTREAEASCRHPYVQDVQTKNPTCTAKGERQSICSSCKQVLKTVEVAALGHNFVHDHTTEPTCGKAGEKVSKCSRCGTTRGENIPPTGAHNYATLVSNTATCTSGE